MVRIVGHARIHPGRRPSNEDACGVDEALGLFVVADGMGGYEGGELASRLVVDTLHEHLSGPDESVRITQPISLDEQHTLAAERRRFARAIRNASNRIQQRRIGRLARMGSTVVALLFRDDRVLVAHVGDSRAYRLRQGRLDQLTVDHAVANDRAAGAPDASAGTVLTRAVGVPGRSHPEISLLPVEPGDTYLLCTDGLSDVLRDAALIRCLEELPPEQAADALVDEAYRRGGYDNITAMVAQVQ